MDKPCDAASFDRFNSPLLPVCEEKGDHFCYPRAIRACAFFDHALVHTKGEYARKPFILTDWQREGIVGPLFGEVKYSEQYGRYIRRYRSGWIELARKQGKSEILAGLSLYLLAFDGEEGAQVYGCAKDRDQARIIWDVAARMVQLSPVLSNRVGLRVRGHEKRILDESTGSYYTVLPRDAMGNLGLDPHAVVFDEIIAQRDDSMWNAMRTSMGSRAEPMMLAATTAGDDPSSFAASEHAECVKIAEDPARAPHRFVFIRNTPAEADPFDEANWHHANPALGDFLSLQALRDEAAEARNDPTRENAFRQFRLNQWVSQATRWMPMESYRRCTGDLWPTVEWGAKLLHGREVWCGLDLSAKQDLTSFCVFVPPKGDQPGHALWWHWIPEAALRGLDQVTGHKATGWVKHGFLRVMEGAVIDYLQLCAEIEQIVKPYKVREICFDKWSGEFVRQELNRRLGSKLPIIPAEGTYVGMTTPMRSLMDLTIDKAWHHHGNPIALWCFDCVEVRKAVDNPELIKPVKPERLPTTTRIDAVITAALAVGAWRVRGAIEPAKAGVGFGF